MGPDKTKPRISGMGAKCESRKCEREWALGNNPATRLRENADE